MFPTSSLQFVLPNNSSTSQSDDIVILKLSFNKPSTLLRSPSFKFTKQQIPCMRNLSKVARCRILVSALTLISTIFLSFLKASFFLLFSSRSEFLQTRYNLQSLRNIFLHLRYAVKTHAALCNSTIVPKFMCKYFLLLK